MRQPSSSSAIHSTPLCCCCYTTQNIMPPVTVACFNSAQLTAESGNKKAKTRRNNKFHRKRFDAPLRPLRSRRSYASDGSKDNTEEKFPFLSFRGICCWLLLLLCGRRTRTTRRRTKNTRLAVQFMLKRKRRWHGSAGCCCKWERTNRGVQSSVVCCLPKREMRIAMRGCGGSGTG